MQIARWVCLVVCVFCDRGFGQELPQGTDEGIATIEAVSRTWQENYRRLKTWQGKARIKSVEVKAKGTTTIERELEFSFDAVNDRLIHYGSRVMRFRAAGSNEDVLLKDQSGFKGALRTSDSLVSVFRTIAHKEQGVKLATDIKPRSRAMRSWLSIGTEFDPVLPMWCNTVPVDIQLKNCLLSWKLRNGKGFSVKSEGNIVEFSAHRDELHAWDFALEQGGNPIRIHWEFGSDPQQLTKGLVHTQFVQVAEVWIPASGHASWKNADSSAEKQLDFVESKVNEPLSDDRFSLTHLEVSDGDPFWDTRFEAGYQFGAPEATKKAAGTPASTTPGKDESPGSEQPAAQQAPK